MAHPLCESLYSSWVLVSAGSFVMVLIRLPFDSIPRKAARCATTPKMDRRHRFHKELKFPQKELALELCRELMSTYKPSLALAFTPLYRNAWKH